MRKLTLDELSQLADSFDESVTAMEEIDHFCSSSDWVLPAAGALMPPREPWIYRDGESFWAFMRGLHPEGFYYLEPLEAMWALACPLVGPDISLLVDGLLELCDQPLEDWRIMALPGLPAGHPLFVAVVANLASRLQLGLGLSSVRLVARLEGGVEAYLGRRSPNFRRGLRRSQKRAQEAGIHFQDASGVSPSELFERIMSVERRGWKGREGVGIVEGGMHDFYQLMLPRLSLRGGERVLFAQRDGVDLAYIFGGVRTGCYRGLQFSFDAAYERLGLGNLLQVEQIRRLHDEGIMSYDLGMHMDYKLRWSDEEQETVTLLLMRD